ncbi:MAG: ATP-binding protein [Gammaproteobacteria bacterium]|nr:ATP-binding protein [Gammaproteobacteria bacterium]MCD8542504.1 ATP-binding protein [Gammaproteobacteria bacterium]
MLRKLYWKIFIWFWLAMCLTIVVIALISSRVTQQSSSGDDDQHVFISAISAAAIIMINSGDKAQIVAWQDYLHRHYEIQLMLLSLDSSDRTEMSDVFLPIVNKIQHNNLKANTVISPPFVIGQPIMDNAGRHYRLVAKLPEEVFEHYSFNRGNIIFRFVAAILMGGFICYLLSLYLLRPIRVLQRAARKLGRGEFQTRVSALLGDRKDEIGELANDFDDMARRLELLVQSKQQLLQDISHELRSPLARLSVALEIARDKSPHLIKELARIEHETEKLSELIRQILSLSSLDALNTPRSFGAVDLVELLNSIVSDANYEAQSYRALPITLSAPQHCLIQANYDLLRSAIENIIRNALRYTPHDGAISVALVEKDKEIEINVEDSGPGIPEEMLLHIFDPFFRADTSRTQETGGFGLGLAIAKRAILLHKGTIMAKNLTESGLRIMITLPFLR